MAKFFTFILLLFFNLHCFANQNRFNVTLNWSKETVDLKIYVNNGIESKTILPNINSFQITISDAFVSKYAIVSISMSSKDQLLPEYFQFYISKKNATINLNVNNKIKIINAIDVTHKVKEYNAIFQPLEVDQDKYAQNNQLDSIYFYNFRKIIIKKLDYIKNNKNSYFAFRKFETEIAPLQFAEKDSLVDSLLNFYKKTFSVTLQKSFEGKKVEKILKDKMIQQATLIKAPKIETVDYLGNKINSDYLKDNYILINFWATWCGPCMAELPAISAIHQKYLDKNLKVISVSFDKNYDVFLSAIKKNKMDWSNVHFDEKFASDFGGYKALPALFLINDKGIIVYNKQSSKEVDHVKLTTLNEILEKELEK